MERKNLQSILDKQFDPELEKLQLEVLRSVYAEYGVNWDEYEEAQVVNDIEKRISINSKIHRTVLAHQWILENAAIRGREKGLTIFGFLRMMIEFRSRLKI